MTTDGGVHDRASGRQAVAREIDVGRLERRQQLGPDHRHRVGRLAVEPVGVALPHPDDIGIPVIPQLDDHGRDTETFAVIGPRDPERVTQLRVTEPRV